MTATHLLFRDDPYAPSCTALVTTVTPEGGVMLDRTVFYARGGGQPGDTGRLVRDSDGAVIPIVDTVKGPEDAPCHVPATDAPALATGDAVTATVDWDRRHRLMRMHTALHLLCSLVDAPVTGGQINDERGRLDFDLAESPDKEALTEALNALVTDDHPVMARWITDEALAAQPELVRTMSVAPPTGAGTVRVIEVAGVDLQPCGGTHVARTGEIGPLVVSKIEKKGRQNRRIHIAFAES